VAAMEEDQNGRTREGERGSDAVLEALGFRVYAVRGKGGFLRGGNENMCAWRLFQRKKWVEGSRPPDGTPQRVLDDQIEY
jgi:hypothetical protein